MAALLANPEIDLKELSQAVLSSTVSLQDKEMKLGIAAELADDKDFALKMERRRLAIRDALAKLGTFPDVVWFIRVRDGESRYICEKLLLSPDSAKPWRTLDEIPAANDSPFEGEPYWIELWRMTPTESGCYRPDYVYYISDGSPIFFGKVKDDLEYGFPDHGILFEHPNDSEADDVQAEYFCENWVPSSPLPFEVGDVVSFDLRPFGPLRTACVIGDKDGHVTVGETKVLYRDYIADGWQLASLSNLERELQAGSCGSDRNLWPSSSIYSRLAKVSTSGLPEENQLVEVRKCLFEQEGFTDRRPWRSVCFQLDWEFSFGAQRAISDEQLAKLLHGDGLEYSYDPRSMSLF